MTCFVYIISHLLRICQYWINDSLIIWGIIFIWQEEFEMEISNDEAEKVSNVGDVVEYIKQEKGLD